MKKARLTNLLTFAGAIPFVVLAIVASLPNVLHQASAIFYFTAYGAVILAFLGGMQWGVALLDDGPFGNTLLVISNVIALAAFVSLTLMSVKSALILQAIFFASVLLIDRMLLSLKIIPGWFILLRYRVSSIVIISILYVWAMT